MPYASASNEGPASSICRARTHLLEVGLARVVEELGNVPAAGGVDAGERLSVLHRQLVGDRPRRCVGRIYHSHHLQRAVGVASASFAVSVVHGVSAEDVAALYVQS